MDKSNIIQRDFDKLLAQIPEKVLRSFTKRSIRDARNLLGKDFEVTDEEIAEISYVIYRAYCIGFTLGNINNIR